MRLQTSTSTPITRVDRMPVMFVIKPDVRDWTTENVGDWLCCLGDAYRCYRFVFENHGIDGSTLLDLQHSDYHNRLGLTVSLHILRIELAVNELNKLTKWYEQQGNGVDLLASSSFDTERFVNRICNLRSSTVLTLLVRALCTRHRIACRHANQIAVQ